MKIKHIFACASLFTIAGTVASSQNANANSSNNQLIQSKPQLVLAQRLSEYAANYYCYQITDSGYVENLQALCRRYEDTLTAPPEPPVILSNGNLECSFLGSVSSSVLSGTSETISIPAACTALRTVNGASVSAQLKSGSRVLGTHTESIAYIEAGETYTYNAVFSSDYASNPGETVSIRFIP